MNIGPRIWKTGLAVTLTLIVCERFNLPFHFLAVIGAIMSMKPSVAQSVIQGGYRMAATVIGGIVGIIFIYFFGSGPFAVGFGVIVAIIICVQLKLYEAIALAGIVVAAVMIDVEGSSSMIYAWDRLLVTFIGITIGVAVNIFFLPPRCEKSLQDEIEKLNYMLKSFYIFIVDGFFKSAGYDEPEVEDRAGKLRIQYEEVRKRLFEFKQEVGYLRSNERVQRYEKIVTRLYFIFERIMGIYQTVASRSARLKEEGLDYNDFSPQYKEILDSLQGLLTITVSMQDSLADYYFGSEHEDEMYSFATSCSSQGDKLIHELRDKIGKWHLIDENRENSLSLMELSNIGYEMDQIYCYLKDIKDLYKSLLDIESSKRKLFTIGK